MKFFSAIVIAFMYLGFAMAGSSPLRGGDQRDLAKWVDVCAKTGEGVYVTQTVAEFKVASMAAYAVRGKCPSLCKTLCAEKFNSFTASKRKCTCTKPKPEPEPVVICVKVADNFYETQTIQEWTDENTQIGDIRSDCASICKDLCTNKGYLFEVTSNGNCDCVPAQDNHGPL